MPYCKYCNADIVWIFNTHEKRWVSFVPGQPIRHWKVCDARNREYEFIKQERKNLNRKASSSDRSERAEELRALKQLRQKELESE